MMSDEIPPSDDTGQREWEQRRRCGVSRRICLSCQYREASNIAASGLTALVVCVLKAADACNSES